MPSPPVLSVLLNAEYSTGRLVELARVSENLGYRCLWYTDLRFAHDCFVGLAAIAARTSTIRLGPGVVDPYSRHPSAIASAVATLDEMTGGRAVLGLGVGGHGLRQLGIEHRLPVAAMREAVEMIRRLLGGGEYAAQGKVISLGAAKLSIKPVQERVPIYFATHGAQVTRLAGEVADGVLIANTLNPAAFDFYVKQLEEGMARANRPPGAVDVGLRVEACIAEDDEAAFAVMRRRVASRVLAQYPHWDYLEAIGLRLPEAFVEIARRPGGAKAEAEAEAAPLMPREVVESMVLAGNAARCAEQLARGLAPRITHLTVRPHAVPGQDVADVIRAFVEDVVPRVHRMRGAARID
ncbi:MAG TPA: LLM class flavin-dependent oxidoreductase [Methylomirabilota bacterium]|jgi:5,10-methylenetetrahydromethanopterin reductase|nr:LLM class flavin-dependent oxidoreductase [Methylomirabilota bacterium]